MSGVTDNPAAGRFETANGGSTAFVEHMRNGDRIALLHAEVPKVSSGQGVGSKLARGALDAVRFEGLKVVPRCEFVAAYIERHPEHAVVTEFEQATSLSAERAGTRSATSRGEASTPGLLGARPWTEAPCPSPLPTRDPA